MATWTPTTKNTTEVTWDNTLLTWATATMTWEQLSFWVALTKN